MKDMRAHCSLPFTPDYPRTGVARHAFVRLKEFCRVHLRTSITTIMSDHVDDAAGDPGAGWDVSTASSVDPAQREQINMFCSVTGADADSALHVLEAHNWDMDRSVMFFMESGGPAPHTSRPASTAAAPVSVQHTSEGATDLDEAPPPIEQQHPSEAVGIAPPYGHEVRRCLLFEV